ncbi:hypothetical protein Anas_09439 [Armadillidium nasatum]|uniref:Uncharacterized protein n=1 Tax=Armadillidium nasatum TaxID=96803 RepID=A0A5N5SSC8_9CRUS|nr:hypothetical protein Anas_09439 [Armadillidium nasatum]
MRYLMKKNCSFVMGFCRKDLNKRKSCKRISKIFNLQRILQITIRDHMGVHYSNAVLLLETSKDVLIGSGMLKEEVEEDKESQEDFKDLNTQHII